MNGALHDEKKTQSSFLFFANPPEFLTCALICPSLLYPSMRSPCNLHCSCHSNDQYTGNRQYLSADMTVNGTVTDSVTDNVTVVVTVNVAINATLNVTAYVTVTVTAISMVCIL